MSEWWQRTGLPFLSLFASMGTLVCCALPALLVALGMGAALAGLVSAAPWLVWLSDHKVTVFAVAGAMIAVAGAVHWQSRHVPCPADPAQARACVRLRKINTVVIGFAAVLYLTGFFFAFVAARVFF